MSDPHVVASHADPPTAPDTVAAPSPRPAPDTVTLAEPAGASFDLPVTLSKGPSLETPPVALPADLPDVTTSLSVCVPTDPARHAADVSDCHSVASQPDPPALPRVDGDASPMLAPDTVTLVDPVTPPFPRRAPLTDALSTDIPPDTLPTRKPAVNATPRLPPTIDDALHRADVSDCHWVRSQAVPAAWREGE